MHMGLQVPATSWPACGRGCRLRVPLPSLAATHLAFLGLSAFWMSSHFTCPLPTGIALALLRG